MILMDKIASRFLYGVLLYCALVLLYAATYFVWEQYNKVLFKKYGQDAVATIIGIEAGGARYDVKYNGKYYRNWIPLNRKRLRSVKIGERYHARVLPDKLPRYVKIILVPLPPCEQDINGEVNRIIMMYGNK
jgi:hypothetical protein